MLIDGLTVLFVRFLSSAIAIRLVFAGSRRAEVYDALGLLKIRAGFTCLVSAVVHRDVKADLASRRGESAGRGAHAHVPDATTRAEQDLHRTHKTDESNYLLSRAKLEDSRISDALDRKNIINRPVSEPPMQPATPSNVSLFLEAVVGTVLALLSESIGG